MYALLINYHNFKGKMKTSVCEELSFNRQKLGKESIVPHNLFALQSKKYFDQ